MGHYPMVLELAGRPSVVIGGGAVAQRKIEGLLAAGASVTVVSALLIPGLEALAREGSLRHVPREYRSGDLAGSELAFAATDDGRVNAAVYREGRERGVWVNVADDPVHCDFVLPAVMRRGPLVVAISTGGASPALSRAVREELEAYFTPDWALLAEVAAEVRRELRGRGVAADGERWHRSLDEVLRRLLREGRREEARAYLLERLGGT